jgi:hypothetical protein
VRATQFGQAHFGQLKNASAVTGLVRRDDGQPLSATDRAHIATAVAQIATWRPDWSTIKVGGNTVKPTTGERVAATVDPVVGPVAGVAIMTARLLAAFALAVTGVKMYYDQAVAKTSQSGGLNHRSRTFCHAA